MELWMIPMIAIAVIIALFPLVFVWYVFVGGVYTAFRMRNPVESVEHSPSELKCSIDADCPDGEICVNGRCVPVH